MDKSYEAPQGRLLTTLVLFVFVLVVLLTLFSLFQNVRANNEFKRLDSEIVQVEAVIQELKDQQIKELVVAQDVIELVDARSVKWSQVIRKLQDLTPVGVFYRSFSGGTLGEVEIAGLADSYDAVADVIRILVNSKDFDNVFVPTVALGTTSDGQNIVSFNLQLTSLLE